MAQLSLLVAAAFLAYWLARRLSGDAYAAIPAAVIFGLSPVNRALAWLDLRLGASLALLPVLLLLFYRMFDTPRDANPGERRRPVALLTVCMLGMALLEPRFATASCMAVWMVFLTGYVMDKRKRREMWGQPFKLWAFANFFSLLAYAPVWWRRSLHPGAVGGPLPVLPLSGFDFTAYWGPSAGYIGIAAFSLALAGVLLSRSYRHQTALWGVVAAVLFWLGLGPGFQFAGKYVWWVPALYRGLRKFGWFSHIDPSFFVSAGQLALAVLAAYGLRALWSLFPPRRFRLVRAAATALAIALVCMDYLRR